MSLITSCPACGTMFRVVPDQLKISEGWVRCGHCAEVFDATAHLADHQDADAADPVTQPVSLREHAPAWQQTLPPGDVPPMPPAPARTPPVAAPSEPELPQESELDVPFVFRRSDLVDDDRPSSLPPPVPPASQPAVLRTAPMPVEDEELAQVSFVREGQRQRFWRRPSVRIGLAFVSLLLAAGLLLQIAYHDRDRLAVSQPGLKPALARMCELLQCSLAAPRQIESVVIESSGFSRLRSDAYRLTFTLRNVAPVEVAAPAMELTLTDTQDQPVLRKVLAPGELGLRSPVLPAAADVSGAVGVTVASNGASRIAGYRLLAFYP
jgi:predicted Zn finger-like uncharacterized protein